MRVLVCVVCSMSLAGAARADAIDEVAGSDVGGFVLEVSKRMLDRTRRSLTLGPSVGAAPGWVVDDSAADLQLSLGVGLLRYDIPPLPASGRLREILLGRARALFRQRLEAAVAGGREVSDEERKHIARQAWAEIKAELLLEVRPKRFEKPGFELMVEVLYALDAEVWDLRLVAGLGVGPVFVAAGTSLVVDDGAALGIPLEVSVPVVLGKGLRAPVVNPFVRYELVATDRADRSDRVFAGARFWLDVL